MRPKPTREWVMLELERLQVRKVSGRLGRKAEKVTNPNDVSGSDEDDDEEKKTDKNSNMKNLPGGMNSLNTIAEAALLDQNIHMDTSSNMNMQKVPNGFNGLNNDSKQGSSMMSQDQLGNGMSSNNNWVNGLTQGMGTQTYNSVGNALLNSDNPSQHYEMLKLHHMNLLNEIKETTFLMNLFKKHRLQKSVLQNNSGTPLLDLLRGTPRPSLQEQLQQIQQQQQHPQQHPQQQQHGQPLPPPPEAMAAPEPAALHGNRFRGSSSPAAGNAPAVDPAQDEVRDLSRIAMHCDDNSKHTLEYEFL